MVQTYVWDAADISDIQYLRIFNKTAVKLLVCSWLGCSHKLIYLNGLLWCLSFRSSPATTSTTICPLAVVSHSVTCSTPSMTPLLAVVCHSIPASTPATAPLLADISHLSFGSTPAMTPPSTVISRFISEHIPTTSFLSYRSTAHL